MILKKINAEYKEDKNIFTDIYLHLPELTFICEYFGTTVKYLKLSRQRENTLAKRFFIYFIFKKYYLRQICSQCQLEAVINNYFVIERTTILYHLEKMKIIEDSKKLGQHKLKQSWQDISTYLHI